MLCCICSFCTRPSSLSQTGLTATARERNGIAGLVFRVIISQYHNVDLKITSTSSLHVLIVIEVSHVKRLFRIILFFFFWAKLYITMSMSFSNFHVIFH